MRDLLLLIGGAAVMLAATLATVYIAMQSDLVQRHIPGPEPGEDPAMFPRRVDTPVQRAGDPAPAEAVEPAAPAIDCAALAERFEFQQPIARSCASDFDCVLTAPRNRCLAAFNIAFVDFVESAVADYDRLCGAAAEPPLALACTAPTTNWAPRCERSVCVLREVAAESLNDATRERVSRPAQTPAP